MLVLVGKLLQVVKVFSVDGVDGRLLVLRNLVQKLLLEQGIVGILVVEGHGALISEEDFPAGEVDDIVGTGGWGQESLCECLGERAARDSDLESTVSSDTGGLALNNIRAQGRSEGVDVAKGEEVGLCSTHREVVVVVTVVVVVGLRVFEVCSEVMTMYGEMERWKVTRWGKREIRKDEWFFRGASMGPLTLDTGGRSGISWSRGIKETISQERNCQDLVWVWTLWDNLIKCYCSARTWEAGFHGRCDVIGLGSYFVIAFRVD